MNDHKPFTVVGGSHVASAVVRWGLALIVPSDHIQPRIVLVFGAVTVFWQTDGDHFQTGQIKHVPNCSEAPLVYHHHSIDHQQSLQLFPLESTPQNSTHELLQCCLRARHAHGTTGANANSFKGGYNTTILHGLSIQRDLIKCTGKIRSDEVFPTSYLTQG